MASKPPAVHRHACIRYGLPWTSFQESSRGAPDSEGHAAPICALLPIRAHSHGGVGLVTCSRDGTCRAWSEGSAASSASGGDGSRISVLKSTAVYAGHVDWVSCVATVGTAHIATGSHDKLVMLWKGKERKPAAVLNAHTDYVTCVAAPAEASSVLVSAGLDGRVLAWDVDAPELPARLISEEKTSVYALDILADGSLCAVGSSDGPVYVRDMRSGQKVCKLHGHEDVVRSLLLVSGPGASFQLASCASDGSVRVWDARRAGGGNSAGAALATSPAQRCALAPHGGKSVRALSTFDASNLDVLATAAADGSVAVCHTASATAVRLSSRHTSGVTESDPRAAWMEGHSALAVACDGEKGLWVARDDTAYTLRLDARAALRVLNDKDDAAKYTCAASSSRMPLPPCLPDACAVATARTRGITPLSAAEMLDDGVHALGISTTGELSVWDVCRCERIVHAQAALPKLPPISRDDGSGKSSMGAVVAHPVAELDDPSQAPPPSTLGAFAMEASRSGSETSAKMELSTSNGDTDNQLGPPNALFFERTDAEWLRRWYCAVARHAAETFPKAALAAAATPTQDTALRRELFASPQRALLQHARRKLQRLCGAPSWCKIDCALGYPRITLTHPTVFQRDAYVSDVASQLPNTDSVAPGAPLGPITPRAGDAEQRMNVGEHVLRALLCGWRDQACDVKLAGLALARVPLMGVDCRGAPWRVSGIGELASARLLPPWSWPFLPDKCRAEAYADAFSACIVSDACEGTEAVRWLVATYPVLKTAAPLGTTGGTVTTPGEGAGKMTFSLIPSPDSSLSTLDNSSLTAPRIVTVRKLCSYVMKNYPSDGSPAPVVEIVCGDVVLPRDMALCTIHKEFWLKEKQEGQMVLHYRPWHGS